MGELGTVVGSSSEAQDSRRARPPPPPGAPDPGVGERRRHQEDFEDEVLRLRTTKSHGMWENTRKIWFSG